MGKQIRKGRIVTPRATFPISGMLSGDSIVNLTTAKNRITEQEIRNNAAMRRVHNAH